MDTRESLTFASVSDLDGDGRRDLIVGAEPSSIRIYPGQGDFTFAAPVELSSIDFPNDAIVVDLNGDGRRDFVVANHYLVTLTVLLNRGGLTFSSTVLTLGGTGNDVTAADVNGDGAIDLVAATSAGLFDPREGHAEVLLGRGDGTFFAPVAYEVRRGAWQVVVGDFTRDGILDIATANRSALVIDDCSGLPKGWDAEFRCSRAAAPARRASSTRRHRAPPRRGCEWTETARSGRRRS